MSINQEHLDLFKKFFSYDSATQQEPLSDEQKEMIAALAMYLLKRELYKDFEANAQEIASELVMLRNNVEENIAALKIYHLARHFDDSNYSDLDQMIEKVLSNRCDSKEQYLRYVAFLYESSRSNFVLKALEPAGIFVFDPELNAIYEKTKKCHRAIKTIGLKIIDEDFVSSTSGLFSHADTKEASLMAQLVILLGYPSDKPPKP